MHPREASRSTFDDSQAAKGRTTLVATADAPQRLVARLYVIEGEPAQAVFDVPIGRLVLGKGSRADVSVRGSGVSRSHAEVVRDERGIIVLTDCGSTNGTFLNGVRLTGPTRIADGDTIRLSASVVLRMRTVRADPDELVLTRRELEIARLVATGRTNNEISVALSISPRTVARHLENAFRKLGVGSRAALATYVMRRST